LNNVRHIFLTGFMASGKTTLGKKLARLMNRAFIDLDEHVERSQNKSIAAIFESGGEALFREMESAYLQKVIANNRKLVVSLGGGTICNDQNLRLVKQSGLLVYIQLTPSVLASRLAAAKTERPLLKDSTNAALLATISAKLDERKKYYEEAHITVNGLNLTPQNLSEAIAAHQENTD
jgi:shikimate kinase